ncbi:hypothetical protein SELMODRAFT_421176 [Selaginella moellendorffii]|uniref:Uncharacterized protein n=1 Tax=Selaginella moellendorffii TaxID=88036 RepID=D8SE92_SELML|nr:hypothetical protein SELMODRAFT_421176 [Selaginella moellendorffii]
MEVSKRVLSYVKSQYELGLVDEEILVAANKDVLDAEASFRASNVILSDNLCPLVVDAHLYYFLALLYVSNHLKGKPLAASKELRKLVNFGQDLSSQSLNGFDDLTPAFTALEELYNRRGDTANEEEIITVEESEEVILVVKRPLLWDVLTKVVHSPYFSIFPEGQAWTAVFAKIQQKIATHKHLWMTRDKITELYNATQRFAPSATQCEEIIGQGLRSVELDNFGFSWGALTVAQAKSLLEASSRSSLARSLFITRPPRSVFLSHLLAVSDCAVHARLWLLRSDSPIYHQFPSLTYRVLAAEAKIQENEFWEAKILMSKDGFQHRIPDVKDLKMRKNDLTQHADFV